MTKMTKTNGDENKDDNSMQYETQLKFNSSQSARLGHQKG